MKSFHILDRELRVRARQRFTFWVRGAVAAVAMLIALSWFQNAAGLGNPAETGRIVFDVLAWLCFGFCLLEGARQTADAISAEKREGTLGLLFLTDLNGLDVTLGKLAACSVHSFYGLLAAFPVLGITLAAGGITAGEFWRTQLALVTTLALASTAGLWISARSREDARAVLASLGLVLGLALAPLLIDAASRGMALPSLSPAAGLWFVGDAAYGLSPSRFWLTQLATLGLATLFLAAAGRRTSRAWREELPVIARRATPPTDEGWNYRVTPRLHARPPPGALDANPAAWLASRQRGLTALVWLALLLPLLSLLVIQFALRWFSSAMVIAGVLSLLRMALEVFSVALLALAAARSPALARREGALELLLCTPLAAEEIVRGHWQVFWRRLRWPLALYALVPGGLYLLFWAAQGPAGGRLPWGHLLLGQAPQWGAELVRMIAVGWLGLWFGLATGNPGQAVGRTLLVALLVPWVAGTVMSVLLGAWLGSSFRTGVPWLTWLAWAAGSLFSLVWSLGAIRWARARLFGRLREAVTSAVVAPSLPAWWERWW